MSARRLEEDGAEAAAGAGEGRSTSSIGRRRKAGSIRERRCREESGRGGHTEEEKKAETRLHPYLQLLPLPLLTLYHPSFLARQTARLGTLPFDVSRVSLPIPLCRACIPAS